MSSPPAESRPARTNRLAEATSPYLLQHRHNPVDWRPWDDEAIEAARAADRPIFLSVGYSTCYWCHVMERECFEDDGVAALLNDRFVPVKVDREERPDVDEIYMAAVQALNDGGGWPMSVFLEPRTLKPFWAGTYVPRDRFVGLLRGIDELWRTRRGDVEAEAERLARVVSQRLLGGPVAVPLEPELVARDVEALLRAHDETHGGFGGAPKFPQPALLALLLEAGGDDPRAEAAVRRTLDRMATGGIHDQVGGGFHRYSVDERWLVPHFEKMLYDNAQLASLYAAAHARWGDGFHAEVVRETLDYVLREMTDPAGGFLSAQDAEVNAREGDNYLWTPAEATAALEAAGLGADVAFALDVYGLDEPPSFRDPHHPDAPPRHVLRLDDRPDALAAARGLEPAEVDARLARVNEALRAARDRREQPGTDDKVLVAWNGLMIAGLSDGGRVLGEPRYVEAAARAADFIDEHVRGSDGDLLRSWRDGTAAIDAFLEDHAMLVHGRLALHEATGEPVHLERAAAIADRAAALFGDERLGGFFDTRAGRDDLFVRARSLRDGALPCGSSMMALSLLELFERTGETRFLDDAVATLRSVGATLRQQPLAMALGTLAVHRLARIAPDRLGGGGTASPVEVSAEPARLALAEGAAATVRLELAVAPGYHVNAHAPGAAYLVPTEVAAYGAGLAVEAEYPEGAPFGEGMRVYEGTVTITARVARTGPLAAERGLLVAYQVCTGDACYAPVRARVPLEIDAAE